MIFCLSTKYSEDLKEQFGKYVAQIDQDILEEIFAKCGSNRFEYGKVQYLDKFDQSPFFKRKKFEPESEYRIVMNYQPIYFVDSQNQRISIDNYEKHFDAYLHKLVSSDNLTHIPIQHKCFSEYFLTT